MELRAALMPPDLDEATVRRLTELASSLDGGDSDLWEVDLQEFNRIAGTTLSIEEFQNISGAEEHETWVRRLLVVQAVRPVADASLAELAEVVRRAMPQNGYTYFEGYMAVFDANVPMPRASSLIYYPMDYDHASNTWGGGRPMGEYDPTPEQIVQQALSSPVSEGRS